MYLQQRNNSDGQLRGGPRTDGGRPIGPPPGLERMGGGNNNNNNRSQPQSPQQQQQQQQQQRGGGRDGYQQQQQHSYQREHQSGSLDDVQLAPVDLGLTREEMSKLTPGELFERMCAHANYTLKHQCSMIAHVILNTWQYRCTHPFYAPTLVLARTHPARKRTSTCICNFEHLQCMWELKKSNQKEPKKTKKTIKRMQTRTHYLFLPCPLIDCLYSI